MIFSNFDTLSLPPDGLSASAFCDSEKNVSAAIEKSVSAFETSSIASWVSLIRVAVFAKPENYCSE
jgi:hypothetical protein